MSTTAGKEQRCHQCGCVLGMTRWTGPLPWWFCSPACGMAYYQKDGPVGPQAGNAEEKK